MGQQSDVVPQKVALRRCGTFPFPQARKERRWQPQEKSEDISPIAAQGNRMSAARDLIGPAASTAQVNLLAIGAISDKNMGQELAPR